jgi:nucleotide-binding universal stress UspA family protein
MQDILALAMNYRRWTGNLKYAAEFSALCAGSLTGIFVCEPIVPLPAMNTPLAFPEVYTLALDMVREARAAEPEFLRWVAQYGLHHAQWLVAEGHLSQALAHAGNWHDLLVLESGGDSPFASVASLGQALLTCGMPCIVVPRTFAKAAALNTISVAWNGSAESVRALHAALPLLRRAQKIVLIHGERIEPFSSIDLKAPLEVDAYLARHGLHAATRACNSDDSSSGADLLRIAGEVGADLLVMGAYGRSRFSEWTLGGATRHVLEHSNIPLFMRH